MKYPRVAVLTLSDNSFFVNVPLLGKEMRDFERELSSSFKDRGEDTSKTRKEGIPFFVALTELNKEEVENLSNQIIKTVLKRRAHEHKTL